MAEPIDENTAASFRAELERLLELPEGGAQDLNLVREKRDALRQRANALLQEARKLESRRDQTLAALERKAQQAKAHKRAGKLDAAQQVKSSMMADYSLGSMLDEKAGKLMDEYFEMMALESEISSFYSVLSGSDD